MITFEEISQLSKPKATRDAYGETLGELGLAVSTYGCS